eukprot:COSAG01_NODE_2413_length_7745_cov_2.532304_2_plen_39_part_00
MISHPNLENYPRIMDHRPLDAAFGGERRAYAAEEAAVR